MRHVGALILRTLYIIFSWYWAIRKKGCTRKTHWAFKYITHLVVCEIYAINQFVTSVFGQYFVLGKKDNHDNRSEVLYCVLAKCIFVCKGRPKSLAILHSIKISYNYLSAAYWASEVLDSVRCRGTWSNSWLSAFFLWRIWRILKKNKILFRHIHPFPPEYVRISHLLRAKVRSVSLL